MVFFEAPHRTAETLVAMADAWGSERRAVVCRELTKTYEEIRRGGLGALAEWAGHGVRGEVTLVVAGAEQGPPDLDGAIEAVKAQLAAGSRLRPAVAQVAAASGIRKNTLYEAVVSSGLPGLP